VSIHDKLRWTWDDVELLTGMSRRWMQREIAAGRMPAPDLRLGRSAGYFPRTITAWMDSMADRQAGRRRT
jgi:predicted DNA-binding transcriptional regulator AlpA